VRDRWGTAARWATLWFAAGVVTLLADGQLTFALGVAFALASLRALQIERTALALAAAGACALSSPVAAVFLAGVLIAGALDPANLLSRFRGGAGKGGLGVPVSARRPAFRTAHLAREATRKAKSPARVRDTQPSPRDMARRPALWTASIALALTLIPNIVFPGAGEFPFAFSSYVAIPLWCGSALFVIRGLGEEERQLRRVLAGYLLASTAILLLPNAMGGNAVRLGALFGGPVLAAVVLTHRPRVAPWFLALFMAGGLYWQLTASVTQVARSVGDPSTSAAYFQPPARWLRAHGGEGMRIEVPPTANHWESAYLATDFDLARGWLRQLDTTREGIFYREDGRLGHTAYSRWLRGNAVSFVALPDATLDYSSLAERRLILSEPPYLDLRWSSPHWRIYEVRDPKPLVDPVAAAAAQVRRVGRQGFALNVTRPGEFLVRVNFTPYWSIARGEGCLLRRGDWTLARATRPGVFLVSANFSLARAWNAATGARKTC